jgi:exodeoxyribonuclease-3
MKIATYNVNGINARLPILLRWLDEVKPDVACLQELKAPQEKIPEEAIRAVGYGAAWHGQKGWNGVAILVRGGEPEEVRRGLDGEPEDEQSRYIEATVRGIRIGCLYLPNGNPRPGPKFDYKLRWLDRLAAACRRAPLRRRPRGARRGLQRDSDRSGRYKPERWVDDALFQPEVREAFRRLVDSGWTDAVRARHPGQRIYTFYDYFRNAFGRDAGLRIDHLLLSPALAARLAAVGIDRDVRGWEKSSDHVPTWVEIADD